MLSLAKIRSNKHIHSCIQRYSRVIVVKGRLGPAFQCPYTVYEKVRTFWKPNPVGFTPKPIISTIIKTADMQPLSHFKFKKVRRGVLGIWQLWLVVLLLQGLLHPNYGSCGLRGILCTWARTVRTNSSSYCLRWSCWTAGRCRRHRAETL